MSKLVALGFCLLWLMFQSIDGTRADLRNTNDGVPALKGEFPHQVSLRFMQDDGLLHFCSGTIVDKNWVLTAGGCCQGRTTMPKAVNIVAGVLSMTVPSEKEQHTKAANMTIHPEFDPTFGSDDLCMIKTEESFQWTDSVKPVMLPQLDAANPPGVQGLVTGWKINVTDKSVPNDLMKVNATVVTNMACNDFLLGETICTDYPRSHDCNCLTGEGCPLDFGGPFALPIETTFSQSYLLLGVVRSTRGCQDSFHDDYPEVYVKAAHYVVWIQQTINNN